MSLSSIDESEFYPLRAHPWERAAGPESAGIAQQYESHWARHGRRSDAFRFLTGRGITEPAEVLTVLRSDLAFRFANGVPIRVEDYLLRMPELGDELVVALAYEEFCLREEQGEAPSPDEYYQRFAAQQDALKRLFEVHELVSSGTASMLERACREMPAKPLPEAGETIGGFHLIEELGRGASARVFLAAERQLADRPVALKVTRRASHEPQTLARLQHTHIVPVFSYRIDPATDLHLLCMPYFGQLTLAHLFEDRRLKTARTGGEILRVVRELAGARTSRPDRMLCGDSGLCSPIVDLPYCHAIAWWGARLAEALQHAHEHGVLHRDIKPSNVLVTPDGRPMLLDFHLARPVTDQRVPLSSDVLGGTFPYMAPEHLEALADGAPERVDARADVYSLGVLLYEAMGARPFPVASPVNGSDPADLLRQAAAQRRLKPPRLRNRFSEVPPAFDAIVRSCLAPNPADRYPTAAALAADLQAFAEDRPLRFTRESLISRSTRWARRHRTRLVISASLLLTLASLAYSFFVAQLDILRREVVVWSLISDGQTAENSNRADLASRYYRHAEDLAHNDRRLIEPRERARQYRRLAAERETVRRNADMLVTRGPRLRFALLGFGPTEPDVDSMLRESLSAFRVFQLNDWTSELPELELLPPERRAQLVLEVEELLFFGAIALAADPEASPESVQSIRELVRTALVFTRTPAPWNALLERCEARIDTRATLSTAVPNPRSESSWWACVQWGLIHGLVEPRSPRQALVWLEQALRDDPTQYWAHYFLAEFALRSGDHAQARAHYTAAIALDPQSPWALFGRARAACAAREWSRAHDDLDTAIAFAEQAGLAFPEAYVLRAATRRYTQCVHTAIADLDRATALSGDRRDLAVQLLAGYLACLPGEPETAVRVWQQARRLAETRGDAPFSFHSLREHLSRILGETR